MKLSSQRNKGSRCHRHRRRKSLLSSSNRRCVATTKILSLIAVYIFSICMCNHGDVTTRDSKGSVFAFALVPSTPMRTVTSPSPTMALSPRKTFFSHPLHQASKVYQRRPASVTSALLRKPYLSLLHAAAPQTLQLAEDTKVLLNADDNDTKRKNDHKNMTSPAKSDADSMVVSNSTNAADSTNSSSVTENKNGTQYLMSMIPPKRPQPAPLIRQIGVTSAPFIRPAQIGSSLLNWSRVFIIYLLFGALSYRFLFEKNKWTIIEALYFSVVTFSTVGYGDLIPSNAASKIFTTVYGIVGIFIVGTAIGVMGSNLFDAQTRAVERVQEKAREGVSSIFEGFTQQSGSGGEEELEEDEEEEVEEGGDMNPYRDLMATMKKATTTTKSTLWGTIFRAIVSQLPLFVPLAVVATILGRWEGWSFAQGLYNTLTTASTVGYGDMVPLSQRSRLLAALFFVPLSVLFMENVLIKIITHYVGKSTAKAERDFLRRSVTLDDLENMDFDGDGEVTEADFLAFMLVAMGRVDRDAVVQVRKQFRALDVGKDGRLMKEDLITLAKRRLRSSRLKRRAKKSNTSDDETTGIKV